MISSNLSNAGDNADVIPGDSNDSSVLKKAGIDRCRSHSGAGDNDADNAFVVLSAKDMSSDVKQFSPSVIAKPE